MNMTISGLYIPDQTKRPYPSQKITSSRLRDRVQMGAMMWKRTFFLLHNETKKGKPRSTEDTGIEGRSGQIEGDLKQSLSSIEGHSSTPITRNTDCGPSHSRPSVDQATVALLKTSAAKEERSQVWWWAPLSHTWELETEDPCESKTSRKTIISLLTAAPSLGSAQRAPYRGWRFTFSATCFSLTFLQGPKIWQ